MDVDSTVSGIAAAIGEPARARMLYSLMDGRARTSTELAIISEVSPSTASVHLQRLKSERLLRVDVQGKHRYYSLESPRVARALEALSVLAGRPRDPFVPSTPMRLRAARTCYDHLAGAIGVALHDRFRSLGWITSRYEVTSKGADGFESLGIDVAATRALRRRFAYACLDWSERRPHLGGSLAAAILEGAFRKKWLLRDPDSRAVTVTTLGRREMVAGFGLKI